jgi:hypothetical protein
MSRTAGNIRNVQGIVMHGGYTQKEKANAEY